MSLIVWMLVAVAAGLALGAALLTLGLRGRRVNDHPICRRCGFDLVGRQDLEQTWGESVCTECGADLKRRRAIAWGLRRRRPAFAAIGAVLLAMALVAGGGLVWTAATNFDWNRVKPVWLLARELTGPDPAAAATAASELRDRITTARISRDAPRSAEQAERIARAVLELQEDLGRTWHVEAGEIFERLWQGEMLPQDMIRRYIAQSAPVTIRTRERIAPGDPLPVQFEVQRRAGNGGMVVLYGSMLDLIVDDERIDGPRHSFYVMLGAPDFPWRLPMQPAARFSLLPLSVSEASSHQWPPAPLDLAPGRYEVTIRVLINRKPHTGERWRTASEGRVLGPPPGHSAEGLSPDELVSKVFPSQWASEGRELADTRIIEVRTSLFVSDAPQIEMVTGEAAARAAQQLQSRMELDRRGQLQLEVRPKGALPPDCGLACEVFIAVGDGEEQLLGGLCYDPESPLYFSDALTLEMPHVAPGAPVRVTLRPSADWARRSVGLTRILGEEIEVELVAPEEQ